MKKYLIFASAILALASCTSDTYLGTEEQLAIAKGEQPISFGYDVPAATRATHEASAELLNNNFVIWGTKTLSSSTQTVFNNYQVNYVASTANTTPSNSADWEYVSYKNLPYGTTTTSGGTLNNDGVKTNAAATTDAIDQSIKYWDFNATQYDFFAYSLGKGDAPSDPSSTTYAKATALSSNTYQLSGTSAQLGACYISELKTMTPVTSSTQVRLTFISMFSKVKLAFYETIPGYSVKDVKFYPSASGSAGDVPYLFASSSTLPNGGTYTITFDSDGKPQLALSGATTTANIAFGTGLTPTADEDYKETAGTYYIGRTSDAATPTDEVKFLPNPQNTASLNIKMDYTLVSRDGSGETIQVTGATAVIPAAYAQWKPNYSYTYIFKISDNTNGSAGAGVGLYPITLDAVVNEEPGGYQETITTVAQTSITTYAKGQIVTQNNEYTAGDIYVVVGNGISLSNSTAKLYTATVEAGAAQGITEQTVANALVNGTETSGTWTITDANGKDLTVTSVNGLTTGLTEVPASDAPDGYAISVNCAKFTASANTTYVFEYIKPAVPAVPATYYEAGDAEVIAGTQNVGDLKTPGSPGSPEEHHYKVIKVK